MRTRAGACMCIHVIRKEMRCLVSLVLTYILSHVHMHARVHACMRTYIHTRTQHVHTDRDTHIHTHGRTVLNNAYKCTLMYLITHTNVLSCEYLITLPPSLPLSLPPSLPPSLFQGWRLYLVDPDPRVPKGSSYLAYKDRDSGIEN
jgi:hypothetical protein